MNHQAVLAAQAVLGVQVPVLLRVILRSHHLQVLPVLVIPVLLHQVVAVLVHLLVRLHRAGVYQVVVFLHLLVLFLLKVYYIYIELNC